MQKLVEGTIYQDQIFLKVLNRWLRIRQWDVFDTDEDVEDDDSATVKHVRMLFDHPMVQDIVRCQYGQSALLLLEAVYIRDWWLWRERGCQSVSPLAIRGIAMSK